MATWRIKSVRLPDIVDVNSGEIGAADFLRVHAISDTDQQVTAVLFFADYAGLQAEWEAGSATTVLDASLDSYIAANSVTDDDDLTSGQQTGKDSYEYVDSP